MQIFLDTANIDEIKKYASWGVVDGVTTNPSLIAKEGIALETRIKEIAEVIDGPISSEVLATDVPGMLEQARKYAGWHKNIYVKLPTTPEGLSACKILSGEGININMTLVFSASQALLCAKAGAALVSPFIGRLDDISEDGVGLIKDIVTIFKNYGIKTKILAASIRHPCHVVEVAKAGADIATMPAEILDKLIKHPLTDAGLKKFLEDYEKAFKANNI